MLDKSYSLMCKSFHSYICATIYLSLSKLLILWSRTFWAQTLYESEYCWESKQCGHCGLHVINGSPNYWSVIVPLCWGCMEVFL